MGKIFSKIKKSKKRFFGGLILIFLIGGLIYLIKIAAAQGSLDIKDRPYLKIPAFREIKQRTQNPASVNNLAWSGNPDKPVAYASSCIFGYPERYRIDNLNDGWYGDEQSWRPSPRDPNPWIKIDLKSEKSFNQIVFGRDVVGGYDDGDLTQFAISISSNDINYAYAASYSSGNIDLKPGEGIYITFKYTYTARYIKMSLKLSSACIDEFEVYYDPTLPPAPPDYFLKNFAWSGNPDKPVAYASSCIFGYPERYRIDNLNDGWYGDEQSWRPSPRDPNPWIKIDLKSEKSFNQIVFGRDVVGGYNDGQISSFEISVSADDRIYTNIFNYGAVSLKAGQGAFITLNKPVTARYVRMDLKSSSACIDEFEIFMVGPVNKTAPPILKPPYNTPLENPYISNDPTPFLEWQFNDPNPEDKQRGFEIEVYRYNNGSWQKVAGKKEEDSSNEFWKVEPPLW